MYVASISHGKDSIAMLHVIKDILDKPLDKIITVDVWFDEHTRAELPPMVQWKDEADKIIYDMWGIPVEHICANRGRAEISHLQSTDSRHNLEHGATQDSKLTYKDIFYRVYGTGKRGGVSKDSLLASTEETIAQDSNIYGFPLVKGSWCTDRLKIQPKNFTHRSEMGWCNT